ncbi:MAG: hypothetical protein ACKOW9_01555 [Candidatus Paceibacterota bacterium]
MKKNTIFTALIGIYFLFLAHHAIHEISFLMFVGIGLALWSHTRKGWATPGLFLLHIGIEWVEWIHNPALFLGWIGRIFHASMDVGFYQHEIFAHKRAKGWLLGGATFLLIFLSASLVFEIPEAILEPLHQFSLGGAVGCVGSHLWFHVFRESRQT